MLFKKKSQIIFTKIKYLKKKKKKRCLRLNWYLDEGLASVHTQLLHIMQ